MRAVRVTSFGGPEVLQLADIPCPEPELGEVLIDVSRAGVNFADTHQIEDSYLSRVRLPFVPGGEVVGTVGDRRVVALPHGGGYAEQVVAVEPLVYDVPSHVDDVTALGLLGQGVTAWVLLRRSVRLEPGESVLIHAGAGGVGSLAVQLAREWGAGRIVATASTPEKRALVLELGADEAIAPRDDPGEVDVVLEMIGGDVPAAGLRALRPFGRMACYGNASRTPPDPVSLPRLLTASATVAGMWLPHVHQLPGDVVRTALTELFALVELGRIRVVNGGEYGLSEARRAHEDLLARRTVGKLVLDPSR